MRSLLTLVLIVANMPGFSVRSGILQAGADLDGAAFLL
jgi:hypothetical protein